MTPFSTNVRLHLVTSHRRYRLAEIAPDWITFRTPQKLPETHGLIVMSVDGDKRRWRVRLPLGADGLRAFVEDIPAKKAYLPTAEEIADACRKIQAGWSEDTERERRCRQNGEPDYGRVRRVRPETE